MIKKGRGVTRDTAWNTKLTKEDMIEIRELYKTREYGLIRLGRRFSVSPTTIRKVVKDLIWEEEVDLCVVQ
jgi:hypothetical protein